jgi:hypothetical protein
MVYQAISNTVHTLVYDVSNNSMQGNVSMNQDGEQIIGLAIKTPSSLVWHHDHLAPALHVGTSSGAIADDLVKPCCPKSKDPGALDMCTAQQLP